MIWLAVLFVGAVIATLLTDDRWSIIATAVLGVIIIAALFLSFTRPPETTGCSGGWQPAPHDLCIPEKG